jgi:hypothetical protein
MSIPDPNFSIPDPGSRIKTIPDPGSAPKKVFSTQKIASQALGNMNRDVHPGPESPIRILIYYNPGS